MAGAPSQRTWPFVRIATRVTLPVTCQRAVTHCPAEICVGSTVNWVMTGPSPPAGLTVMTICGCCTLPSLNCTRSNTSSSVAGTAAGCPRPARRVLIRLTGGKNHTPCTPCTFQLNVVHWPCVIVVGLAVKLMPGTGVGGTAVGGLQVWHGDTDPYALAERCAVGVIHLPEALIRAGLTRGDQVDVDVNRLPRRDGAADGVGWPPICAPGVLPNTKPRKKLAGQLQLPQLRRRQPFLNDCPGCMTGGAVMFWSSRLRSAT